MTVFKREDADAIVAPLGFVFRLDGGETGGSFALVEHPIEEGILAAPMHTHHREDEFSYILAGTIGAQIGDRTLQAGQGTIVAKPRGIPHTFWNPGPGPALVLEVISPAGFERFFREVMDHFPPNAEPDIEGFLGLCARYELDMDMDSHARLVEEHRLRAEM